jgi:hypothetical protein
MTGVAKYASDSLMSVPGEVLKHWPYIFGYAVIDWASDNLGEMMLARGSPTWARAMFTGLVDTSKFTYFQGKTDTFGNPNLAVRTE